MSRASCPLGERFPQRARGTWRSSSVSGLAPIDVAARTESVLPSAASNGSIVALPPCHDRLAIAIISDVVRTAGCKRTDAPCVRRASHAPTRRAGSRPTSLREAVRRCPGRWRGQPVDMASACESPARVLSTPSADSGMVCLGVAVDRGISPTVSTSSRVGARRSKSARDGTGRRGGERCWNRTGRGHRESLGRSRSPW